MMRAGRFAIVMAATVLAVGCHSGGGNRSGPTSTKAGPSTTGSPSHVVAGLDGCPQHMPTGPLAKLNAGVPGLDKTLVPIAALNVRICSYDGVFVETGSGIVDVPKRLVGQALLEPSAARRLEVQANRLPQQKGIPGCTPTTPGTRSHFYFLTFANDSQRVDVLERQGCIPGPDNGQFTAIRTTQWDDELRRYTTKRKPTNQH